MTTVITGATLIDGTDAEPVRDASVVIEGERIVEAGRLDHLPPDAEVIDVAGKTVLPGLIDSHVHFCSSWGSMQQRALAPPTLAAFEAAENARVTLDAGFTSVREASGSPQGFKLAVERGLIPGPRMRIAVGALSQTGGHGDGVLPSGVRFWRHWGPEWVETICDGPDEVRKTVRTILRLGAEDREAARDRRRDVALGRARLATVHGGGDRGDGLRGADAGEDLHGARPGHRGHQERRPRRRRVDRARLLPRRRGDRADARARRRPRARRSMRRAASCCARRSSPSRCCRSRCARRTR